MTIEKAAAWITVGTFVLTLVTLVVSLNRPTLKP